MTKLSTHFDLEEFTFSETAARKGIDNTPTKEEIAHALKYLIPGLEQIREILGQPIKITSGFRSISLNAVTPGSSNTSQHTKFEAADIVIPLIGNPATVAKEILVSQVKFDQMILEYNSWVHISFSAKPRRSILSKYSGTPYLPGIVDKNGKSLL